MNEDQFHMFWGGPFSQWFPCYFTIDGIEYNCTEQYMMAKKAQLFGDDYALRKIMAISDPREQKSHWQIGQGFC